MTDQQQPSPGVPVPPDKLIQEFYEDNSSYDDDARWFAAWGADEQLRLCERWVEDHSCAAAAKSMREAMRPEPPAPSLKQQALELFSRPSRPASYDGPAYSLTEHQAKIVCRALEALSDD